MELRIGSELLYSHVSQNDQINSNFKLSQISIGGKYQFTNKTNPAFSLAVITNLLYHFKKTSSYKSKISPELILAFDKDLSETFSIGINIGSKLGSEDETFQFFYSVSTGIKLLDRLTSYIEISEELNSNAEPINLVNGGFLLLITSNFQLDTSTGVQLIKTDSHWFINTGFSLRLFN